MCMEFANPLDLFDTSDKLEEHQEVLEFIGDIKRFDVHGDITNLFTKGYCYGFSLMLKQAFKHGQIVWDKYNGHAVFMLHNKYYDINGEYTPQNNNMLYLVDVYIAEKELGVKLQII